MKKFTDATFLVSDGYRFENGLFSGYDKDKRSYDKTSWGYQKGADGFVLTDDTLQNPRCVFNLLKQHYARYTVDMVVRVTGTPKEQFLKVCEMIASTSAPDKTATFLYALGWTQHSTGTQMIRTTAMVQLLLGNIGMAGGGVNALRGHSNIQGLTDLGLLSNMLPGYLTLAGDKEQDFKAFLDKRASKPLRPGQMSFWQNYPAFHVSLMKSWYGDAATLDNDWCYEWLPKLDKLYDVLQVFEMMHQGQLNGYFAQGFNPLAAFPDKAKIGAALAKLKYLVVIDPLATETSEFWKNFGEFNDVDPVKIQTEVFRLPSGCFAEEDGSLVSSSRVLQWHYKGADAPAEARGDAEIIAGLFLKLREMYRKEGGAFSAPILNLNWPYMIPASPSPDELAREYNGKALADVTDPKDPAKVLAKTGEQLAGFAQLRNDGSTACGCWIFSGAWTQAGNLMARRDNSDPSGLGNTPNWAFAWPANRRIIYNRASCDSAGKPWDPKRKVISWDSKSQKWQGMDIPDMRPDAAPEQNVGPFIMNPEGVARLFGVDKLADGPFPEHYEPFETPLDTNPLHPGVVSNPAARVFKGDLAALGTSKDFPYIGTTYRLTEHFHFWTKHVNINAILQPEQFVEIDEELAGKKGIKSGDHVKVSSKRGHIKAVAVVTKRLKALDVDGRRVHTVGIPIHWGFKGVAKNGYIANTLTPFVGDANSQTPEFKSFLVTIEKV